MKIKQTLFYTLTSLIISQGYLFAQTTNSENLVGIWMGRVKMGDDSPRLVFEIVEDTENKVKGTVSSPDKGIKGIPLSTITQSTDSITFEIAAAMATFKGVLSPDKYSIEGIWQEGVSKQPLVLEVVTAEEAALSKPVKSINYKLQLTNDHFNFYLADKDQEVLKDLVPVLNESYLELAKLMKTSFSDKIDVIIYPDIKAFHKAIYLENAPEWVVGAAGKNELKMVSPLNPGSVHSYESLVKSIVHELCHTIVLNMREQGQVGLPKWLDEGFAFYYANQGTEEAKEKLINKLQASEIPSWDTLNKAETIEFGDQNGYLFSASIVEFLVKRYGYENIRKLILNPTAYEKIFGKSEAELEKEWVNYLSKNQ